MSKLRSMGAPHAASMKTDTWLTPPSLLKTLGEFDLDPCCPQNMPWKTATTMLTPVENGLTSAWAGRVWLNPPYSNEVSKWLKRLSEHNNGICLIFARVETRCFTEYIWGCADAILFLEGRLHFCFPSGERASANSGAPSCLVAYGTNNCEALLNSGLPGHYVRGWKKSQPRELSP